MMGNEKNPARLEDLIAASDGRLRDLGAEIKHQRILQGLTAEELSQIAGVPAATIMRMERDSSGFQLKTVERVCRALEMRVTIGTGKDGAAG